MDDLAAEHLTPRDAIERLEERIAALEAKIESCRKFEAAARFAVVLGGALFVALVLRLITFDPLALLGAIAAGIGGIVMLGSNSSTRREATAHLAAAEAERAAMIGEIDLRVVSERPTLH
jgi:hypothetical protein